MITRIWFLTEFSLRYAAWLNYYEVIIKVVDSCIFCLSERFCPDFLFASTAATHPLRGGRQLQTRWACSQSDAFSQWREKGSAWGEQGQYIPCALHLPCLCALQSNVLSLFGMVCTPKPKQTVLFLANLYQNRYIVQDHMVNQYDLLGKASNPVRYCILPRHVSHLKWAEFVKSFGMTKRAAANDMLDVQNV